MDNLPGLRASLRRLAIAPPTLPMGARPAVSDTAPLIQIDDRTADYILAVRDGFERLSDAARQMAAVLILDASGAAPVRDHPARMHARRNVDEARAIVGASKPTSRAAHHHRHLAAAIAAFDMVLAEQPSAFGADDVGRALTMLRQVTTHLRWASAALPGFEVVALGQGCGCCPSPLHPNETQT